MIVTRKKIVDKVESVWSKVLLVAEGKGKANKREKVEFSLDQLLDIVFCTHPIWLCAEARSGCADPSQCRVRAHSLCSCSRLQKVPVIELEWLRSQRGKVGEKGVGVGIEVGVGWPQREQLA